MTFIKFSTYVYHQHTNTFFTSFTKLYKFLKIWQHRINLLKTQDGGVPTTREFFPSPINTHFHTSTLKRHPKLLKPTKASLFNILPTVFLVDIEIWVSSLNYCDKFKVVFLLINYMYNPVLFAVPRELWTPYHHFGVFRWYNEGYHDWAHRRIPAPYNVPWMFY